MIRVITFFPLLYIGKNTPVSLSFDTFETSSVGTDLNGQHYGVGWFAKSIYRDTVNYVGLQSYDTFESYILNSDIYNLSGCVNWITSYTSSILYTGLQAYDTIESYISGSLLNNLNDGIGWSSPYLDISDNT